MRNTVTSVDNHGIQSVENQDVLGKLFFRSGSDRYVERLSNGMRG